MTLFHKKVLPLYRKRRVSPTSDFISSRTASVAQLVRAHDC